MNRRFDLAVLGGDTPLGSALLELIAERRFPAGEVSVLALDAEEGASVDFVGHALPVDDARGFEFSQVQLAFLASDDPQLVAEAERAADAGCVVIDAANVVWRDPAIPRVIAEINPERLADFNERGIVSAPDRLLVPLMLALAPLHALAPLKRVTLTAVVPVSDGGIAAFQDLAQETTALLNARHFERRHFPMQIAFNLHGQIGATGADGLTERERQIGADAQQILQSPGLAVSASLVQGGVFYGYAVSVELEAEQTLSVESALAALRTARGIELVESVDPAECPSPVTDATASAEVRVARLRRGATDGSIALWMTADNIRAAAARNALNCADLLVREHL